MNIVITVFLTLVLSSTVSADEDDNQTRILTIEHGKLTGERHEIELYDYHTGTIQTVDVYRKPEADKKVPLSAGTVEQPVAPAQTR